MRHFPSSWSDSLLARLGFRRKPRRARKGDRFFMRRRPQLESLEERAMLATYTVDSAADTVAADGFRTLREALTEAYGNPGPDTINFADNLTANGPVTITLSHDGNDPGIAPDHLAVDSDVTITGPGQNQLSISGNGLTRVFVVNDNVNADVSGVTITKGRVTGSLDGGGIYNSGHLVLSGVVLHDNEAGRQGGAIYSANSEHGSTLRLIGTTVSENRASEAGGIKTRSSVADALVIENSSIVNNTAPTIGGIFISGESTGSTKTAKIINSTFSGNSATAGHAGAILVNGGFDVTIVNSTITNNSASGDGGGIRNSGSGITLHNTIVAGNTSSNVYTYDWYNSSAQPASSNNLIGINGGINLTNSVNGNQVGTTSAPLNPGLGPLADNGGNTWTQALLASSPAIDKGSNAKALDAASNSLTVDQRGNTRIVDSGVTGPTGGTVDVGAFEFAFTGPIVVSTLPDEDDGNYGENDLSLRESLALATLIPGSNTITFDEELFANGTAKITLTYDGSDAGSVADQLVASNVNIEGPGADKLIISGGNQTRVLYVDNSTIQGVTITEGNSVIGGGVFGSAITLREARITGNTATSRGGGIYTNGSLLLISSEVSNNTAVMSGGGVFSYRWDSDYDVTIENSTISGNRVTTSSTGRGGGIYSYLYYDYGSKLDFTITNSTISGNSAKDGGGLFFNQKSVYDAPLRLKLHNTIVAGNVDLVAAADDVAGDSGESLDSSSSHNLFGQGGSGGLQDNVNGNIVLSSNENAGLLPLDFYVGPTRTHALLPTSSAIDMGSSEKALDWANNPLTLDQRGFARDVDFGEEGPEFGTVDIGAFEFATLVAQEADFDGDGRHNDFATYDPTTKSLAVFLERDRGYEGSVWVQLAAGATWELFKLGDFNGDGRDDLMFQSTLR